MSNSSHHDIIDIHNHFMNKNMFEVMSKVYPKAFTERFSRASPEQMKMFQNMPTPEERANQMVEDMKGKGIDQILPMTFPGDEASGFLVHKLYPHEFPGTVPMLMPEYHTDPEV